MTFDKQSNEGRESVESKSNRSCNRRLSQSTFVLYLSQQSLAILWGTKSLAGLGKNGLYGHYPASTMLNNEGLTRRLMTLPPRCHQAPFVAKVEREQRMRLAVVLVLVAVW